MTNIESLHHQTRPIIFWSASGWEAKWSIVRDENDRRQRDDAEWERVSTVEKRPKAMKGSRAIKRPRGTGKKRANGPRLTRGRGAEVGSGYAEAPIGPRTTAANRDLYLLAQKLVILSGCQTE